MRDQQKSIGKPIEKELNSPKKLQFTMQINYAVIVLPGELTMHTNSEPYSWLARYLKNPHNFHAKFQGLHSEKCVLMEALLRGFTYGASELPLHMLPTHFSSYVTLYTYKERTIFDMTSFTQFWSLLSALSAQDTDYIKRSKVNGICPEVAKESRRILLQTNQLYEVPSYGEPARRKVSKYPKVFVADTGIACYLQSISDPKALAGHPFLGAMFATFCFSMIRGLSSSLDMSPLYYHWRTANGAEVDILLELNGHLYPIEIKCKSNVTRNDLSGMRQLRETYPHKTIMPGLVIYAGDHCYFVDENTIALPWNSI